jgi:alkanesulfonate monooxygenase SsuD/methylene tetrahydromethanopterin reductase-like flavin-dependent oxidoreductase (luciferase family)
VHRSRQARCRGGRISDDLGQIEAMQENWTREEPGYHSEIVDFLMMTEPKPTQRPHPAVIIGGTFPTVASRAMTSAALPPDG